MTTLAIYTSQAFNDASGVALAPNASVVVKKESDGSVAPIFSDRAGTVPIVPPLIADAKGYFEFYALSSPGGYRIEVTFSGNTKVLRYQAVGTAAESDCTTFGSQIMNAADAAAALALLAASNTAAMNAAIAAATGGKAVKQTALFGRVDLSGYANYMSAGSGLRLSIAATAVALALNFSNGATDTVESFAADIADITGADLPANNTNYVYRTLGGTWGVALVPPDYGYAFDRTRGALLNFEAADATTAMVDDFGNTWTATGNAQIDTAQFKFGTASLLLDGTGDYITTTNITSLGDGSWEISAWFRLNALPGSGTAANLIDARNSSGATFGIVLQLFNTAGTTKLRIYASSDGASHNIASAVDGANTTWTLNQWNKARLVFDALAGTYRVYLSLNGAAESQDISVSSTARICPFTQFRVGADSAGTGGFNGWIDGFRFVRCATKIGTETPSASAPTITDYPYHWFSIPEMKMYEITGASTSAGTNPTPTRRDRLFIGEADSAAGTISVTRTYALRGQYESPFTTPLPGAGVQTTLNTNIGSKDVISELTAENILPDAGFSVGDRLVSGIGGTNTTYFTPTPITAARNTISFVGAPNTAFQTMNKTTGIFTGMASTAWKYQVRVRRAW